jgi:transposase
LALVAAGKPVGEVARLLEVSEQSISNWKRLFLESGKAGLVEGGKAGPNARERQLLDEVEDLKAALGEAHVELRVWKKSAEGRLGPTRSSR